MSRFFHFVPRFSRIKMAAKNMCEEIDEGKEQLILKLHEINGVKFGDFKLKSGIQSPAYFDLRVIVSYPELLPKVSEYLWNAAKNVKEKFVSLCGVPYTALPIATVMSVEKNMPMLIRRREAKDYGTKKMIEGHYKEGDIVLVVEDVVTTGSSVYETVKMLNEYGLKVKDAVVLLEREQGGTERLRADGIQLHSVFTMTQLITTLYKHNRVDETMYNKVLKFIAENKFDAKASVPSLGGGEAPSKRVKEEMKFDQRACTCINGLAKRLFYMMHTKKTNLALSVDLTKSEDILQLVDKVGEKICIVKTHVDIIEDFSQSFVQKLQELAIKHEFLIFEDRKFADIGNTVKHQYNGGMYKIADWADIVNAHSVPGPGVVEGLKQVALEKGSRGCLMIAEMSSAGNLAKEDYTKATADIAEEHADYVMGFICQKRICEQPYFVHMTPGVKLQTGGDNLGQQYMTPRDAIYHNKSDIIIVGRGITTATDPVAMAETYRQAAFTAYIDRVS